MCSHWRLEALSEAGLSGSHHNSIRGSDQRFQCRYKLAVAAATTVIAIVVVVVVVVAIVVV